MAAGFLSCSSAGLFSYDSRLCPVVFYSGNGAQKYFALDYRVEWPYMVAGRGRGRHHASAVFEFEKGGSKPFKGFYCPWCSSGRGLLVTVGPGLYRPGACYRYGVSPDVYAVNEGGIIS